MTEKITELPIPTIVAKLLEKEGIHSLYPPQKEAIDVGVLNGVNLVVAAPTASGKTLIAELAMLKNIFENKGKAIYLVPLRALASEKYKDFKKYESIGVKVAITTGDYDSSDPWLADYDIIVTTNEKADSLLRHKPSWIHDISTVIADEIHLINDLDRGPTLEIVLTKLMQINPSAQVIALSATINNANELAEWLNAKLIHSEWRPVPLKEGVCYRSTLLFSDGSKRKIKQVTSNPTVNLVLASLSEGGQVLVFTNTRKKTVELAQKIAKSIKMILPPTHFDKESLSLLSINILNVGEVTKISKQISELVLFGVAYHHAGLNYSHRELIENAFRNNILKVIVATPTLAAGVNLPARYVIIDNIRRYEMRYGYGYVPIPILEYKQMIGRAGRPKYDKLGYAITVVRSRSEIDFVMGTYINGIPEDISSKLANENILIKHILASIASKFASNKKDLFSFFSKTFYGFKENTVFLKKIISDSINYLLAEEFIIKSNSIFYATRFGERVSQLYISPSTAIIFRDYLVKSNIPSASISSFGLLHIICHTPDMPKINISRNEIYEYEDLLEERQDELLIPIDSFYNGDFEYYDFLSEIKVTRLLEDWINEVPEDIILDRYGIGSGDLLRLKENAEWLLYAAGEIAKIFEAHQLTPLIKDLRIRVKHGIKQELLELIKLEGIGRVRARILYNAGYTSIEKLKTATKKDLERLPNIGPKLAEQIVTQVNRL